MISTNVNVVSARAGTSGNESALFLPGILAFARMTRKGNRA